MYWSSVRLELKNMQAQTNLRITNHNNDSDDSDISEDKSLKTQNNHRRTHPDETNLGFHTPPL